MIYTYENLAADAGVVATGTGDGSMIRIIAADSSEFYGATVSITLKSGGLAYSLERDISATLRSRGDVGYLVDEGMDFDIRLTGGDEGGTTSVDLITTAP